MRAHQHATVIKVQSISKSISGSRSKIHLAVDANGNPIEFIIRDGTTHDVKVAPDLIEGLNLEEIEVLCADHGDDSELLREKIKSTTTKASISRNITLNPVMNIWTGIYIRSDTELKMHLQD